LVALRETRPEDVADYARWYRMSEWQNWDNPWDGYLNETQIQERLDYKQRAAAETGRFNPPPRLEIETVQGGIHLGDVSRYWVSRVNKCLEIGICLYEPLHWNTGYGREALALWCACIFEYLKLPRIGLSTWSGNKAMMKSAKHVGFKVEGIVRQARLVNSQVYDQILMGLLPEELIY
jgi:RimJ/RimL family protein N-acetyltransferase